MKKFVWSLFLLMISCNSNEGIHPEAQTIKVPEQITSKMIDSDSIFNFVRFIPLETSKKCFISKIDKLAYFKNRLYIFDSKLKSIFVFDEEGKFIFKINNVGKGPNEYLELASFCIDEYNNNIVVLSGYPKKVMIFDLSGNFIKEIKMDIYPDIICNLKENYACLV